MSENLDLQRENDYLKDTIACMQGEIAALKSGTQPTDSQQPQLEMPCESTFLGWCGVQHYDQVQALAVYRYIAWHIVVCNKFFKDIVNGSNQTY